jgi:hypothetical protein
MTDDEELGLHEVASVVAPAQERIAELSRSLGGLGAYVCALIPSSRAIGRESITAVTPGGESLTLTIAMAEALAEAVPVLVGMYPVDLDVPADDIQGELWRAESARVQELDLTLRLRSGRGTLSDPIQITAPWGLSPGHADLVLVCAERPRGWPR